MKKFLLLTLVIILGISFFSFNSKKEINQMSKRFNVYINDSGSYIKQESDVFPTTGYYLNTTESTCNNGGTISQNTSNKSINISLNSSDKCNLYFDPESDQTLDILHALNNDITLKSNTPNFSKISPLPTGYIDDGIGGTETNYTPPINTNYITYGDDYTFNASTGRYSLTNPQTCQWDVCYTSLVGKYFSYRGLYNDSNIHNDSNQQTLYQITSNSTSTKVYYKTTSKTVTAYDTSDMGLFKMNDDYGESLYFRGDITNNYVKYGKDKNSNDMYWRIIRINGDGTLRIIYDGTSAHDNGEVSANRKVGESAFNSGSGRPFDAGYIGFMYGNFTDPVGCVCTDHDNSGNCIYTCTGGGSTSYEEAHANVNSSNIRTYLDNWYLENIVNTGFENYISDEIFCNDRTKRNDDLGYGQNTTILGAYTRIRANKNPSLKCIQKNDSFTKEDEIFGNGKLTYPVGLITADEMSISGNVYGGDYNYKSYLYKGIYYWTLSPSDVFRGQSHIFVFNYYIGTINSSSASYGVVPVINLSKEAVQSFIGDGTKNNPFTVSSS